MRSWTALGFDAFAAPLWVPAVLAATALLIVLALRRRTPAVAWPALAEARAAGARRFDAVGAGALALRALAFAAAGLVLAQPIALGDTAPDTSPGLDLVLAMDASASMRALDVAAEGESRTRFDLAREVVARFAARRAAEGDRVALVLFGERAFTQVPLTRDGRLLAAALERVEPGIAGEATALGDALVLATKRALGGGPEPEGRLVVLLTDGHSNAGSVPLDVAIEVAARHQVRVHTVGIGVGGEVPVAAGARGVRFERHDLDTPALQAIAAATGGRPFLARRSADLGAVYAEIDGLERVLREAPPRRESQARPQPLLLLAAGALLAELGLARLARRRLP